MTTEGKPVAIAKGAMVAAYRIRELHQTLNNSIQYWGINCLLSTSVFIEELYHNEWVNRQDNLELNILDPRFFDYYQTLDQIGEQFNALPYKHLEGLARLLRFNNTLYWIRSSPIGQPLSTWLAEQTTTISYEQLSKLFVPILDDLHLHHRLKRCWFNITPDQIRLLESGQGVLIAPSMEICLERTQQEWTPLKDLQQLITIIYFGISKKYPYEAGNVQTYQPLKAKYYPNYPKRFIQALNQLLKTPQLDYSALQLKQALFPVQEEMNWSWLRKTVSVGLGLSLAAATPTPATQQGLTAYKDFVGSMQHSDKINTIRIPPALNTEPVEVKTATTPVAETVPTTIHSTSNTSPVASTPSVATANTETVVPHTETKPAPASITNTAPTTAVPVSVMDTQTSDNAKACILGLKDYCSKP